MLETSKAHIIFTLFFWYILRAKLKTNLKLIQIKFRWDFFFLLRFQAYTSIGAKVHGKIRKLPSNPFIPVTSRKMH